MTEQLLERQEAYGKLAEVVARLVQSRRSTRSAGVKPRLQWTLEGFDEQRLGFRTFRDFLEAAAAAGHVVLRPVSNAPDVEVLPIDTPAEPAPEIDGRIRRDVWTAFVDWRQGWLRLYDRDTDAIGWLPLIALADEPRPYAALRQLQAEQTQRFVAIEPTDQDATLAWIRDFVAGLEGLQRKTLARALEAPRPIQAFVVAAREVGVIDDWSAVRLREVRARVEAWARDHDLAIDLAHERPTLSPPPRMRPQDPSRAAATHRSTHVGDDELRERVLAAVRHMSRAELLRLPIPIEYILTD